MKLTNWPILREKTTTIGVLIGIVTVTAMVQLTTGKLLASLVSAAALMLSCWRLWMPVSFELGPAGMKQACWRFERLIPWMGFSGYEKQSQGVVLIPSRTYGAKSLFGSLYISCPQQQREVVALLEHYLPHAAP